MGDRQPPQQPPGGGAADLRRPQASPAGAPGAQPPSSMAGQAMTSQYALAAQQYQQAALAMAAAGSANPMAVQAQAQLGQQLLAQYQQLAMNPEMLLKQYPHLPGAGIAGPPHMLGRNPAADHHLLMQQAREREVAAERERQAR